MKRLSQFIAALILVALVSCATKETPFAEISVFTGDPPQPEKMDGIHLMNQRAILTSYGFARHLEEKFSLSKTWGVSPAAACARISNAISVEIRDDAGRDETGTYVVKLQGLEHKQAVELLNELCDFYSLRDDLVSMDENSNPQKMTVTFLKRAR